MIQALLNFLSLCTNLHTLFFDAPCSKKLLSSCNALHMVSSNDPRISKKFATYEIFYIFFFFFDDPSSSESF